MTNQIGLAEGLWERRYRRAVRTQSCDVTRFGEVMRQKRHNVPTIAQEMVNVR